jgi:hypothetical protein
MFIISINFIVQLLLAATQEVYNFQNRNFHGSLVKIRRFIFDDFDCNNFHRLHILTLDNLRKRPLSKNIENKISKSARTNLEHTCVPDQALGHH